MLFRSFLGDSVWLVTFALGIVSTPVLARISRASTMSWSEREFVMAARAQGAKHTRVMIKEILPNVLPTVMSMMVIAIAGGVAAEGGLAYLNLSVAPPQPTWGAMIAASKDKLDQSLYPVLIPGMALFLTVLSLTLIGDTVQKRQARNSGAI